MKRLIQTSLTLFTAFFIGLISPKFSNTFALTEPIRLDDSTCQIAGCSGQLCVDPNKDPVYSTCEWREEYACYKTAECKRQENGECGWTITEELKLCLKNPTKPILTPKPTCGNGTCEPGESNESHCPPCNSNPCPVQLCWFSLGSCPQDCEAETPIKYSKLCEPCGAGTSQEDNLQCKPGLKCAYKTYTSPDGKLEAIQIGARGVCVPKSKTYEFCNSKPPNTPICQRACSQGEVLTPSCECIPVELPIVPIPSDITPTPEPSPSPKPDACLASGGSWKIFENGCVDSCYYAHNPLSNCTHTLTNGCDCGPDKCWDGEKCTPNPEGSFNPQPFEDPFPTLSPNPPKPLPINTKNRFRLQNILKRLQIYRNWFF